MAHYESYKCRSCDGAFRFFHHPDDLPPPEICPLCGHPSGDIVDVFIPQSPPIKGVVSAAADQVYRSMEESSAARAEMMAEMAGGDAKDYAFTKITDLNDRQREGDIAAKMPSANEVMRFMQSNTQAPVGNAHAAQAMEFARQAHTGYMPYSGLRTQITTNQVHEQIRARMQRAGQMNR